MEGQNAIKHNQNITLSAQELVDCSKPYGAYGCDGGWMYEGYNYIQHNGVSALKDYIYTGTQDKCKKDTTARVNLTLTGYTLVPDNEEALRQAVGE